VTVASDPYAVLGIDASATDAELRAAYRQAVLREHPDHNGGSPESARRFEAVQEAYALIRVQRTRQTMAGESRARASQGAAGGGAGPDPTGSSPAGARPGAGPGPGTGTGTRAPGGDPAVDARLAELERQLAKARGARERARRAAREAEARLTQNRPGRPSDEELGYITTEDSFGRIVSDAASELFSEVRRRDVPKRVSDLIDELGSKLTGEPPER
jgi:curved DNA-binding protein CbpA